MALLVSAVEVATAEGVQAQQQVELMMTAMGWYP